MRAQRPGRCPWKVRLLFWSKPHDRERLSRLRHYEDLEREARNAEIVRLRSLPYCEYLATEHWAEVREKALAADRRACRICSATNGLNVHHRTYVRLGCEDPLDLITLCSSCHGLFHGNGKLALPPA